MKTEKEVFWDWTEGISEITPTIFDLNPIDKPGPRLIANGALTVIFQT